MTKVRSRRNATRKKPGKAVARRTPGRASQPAKKGLAAKRKPTKRAGALQAKVGAKSRGSVLETEAARPLTVDRTRSRKLPEAPEVNGIPEIPPPLPAPIASFTF